ncbi:MAG: DUF6580 family putative transport protein [Patescibacteria group bacterium]
MSKKELIFVSLAIISVGIASRLLPHPWNTTPVTAIAIFSSAYLGFRYSFAIFLAIMFVTDIFLGFYQWQIMLAVYGSFATAALIGLFLRKKKTVGLILVSALSSSVLFFLITNWAVWQFGTMYEHSLTGLFQSYFMALPFFRNSLLGDIFYTSLLFGVFEVSRSFVVNRFELLSAGDKKYNHTSY